MPLWLIGKTGYSFFDFWSIGHFCFWVWAGTITAGLGIKSTKTLLVCVLLAYVWEVIEHYGETWFPKLAAHPESFWNRAISDPLMCVSGILLAWFLYNKLV